MRIFIISVVCLALALAAPAFARMYKWTDKNGKLHFSDNLKSVPLDQRNKKHIKKMKSTPGGKNNLPTALPARTTPKKHLGAKKKEGSNNRGTGVDKQKVNELLRINQKKHYNH